MGVGSTNHGKLTLHSSLSSPLPLLFSSSLFSPPSPDPRYLSPPQAGRVAAPALQAWEEEVELWRRTWRWRRWWWGLRWCL